MKTSHEGRRNKISAPVRRARGTKANASLAAGTPEDEIYERIQEAMLDHRLAPGTKLKEVALAELFAVKRNVIHKVLLRLAHSKLVVLRRNRGAMVASPTIEESRCLFAARRAIEGAMIDALTRKLTKEQIRELRALVKQEQEAYRQGKMSVGLKKSIEFHCTVANLSGNTVLAEFLDQLLARTPLIVLAYRGTSLDASCSSNEHSLILDAVATGETSKAVAAMTSHLESLESQLNLHEEEEEPTDLAEIFGMRRR